MKTDGLVSVLGYLVRFNKTVEGFSSQGGSSENVYSWIRAILIYSSLILFSLGMPKSSIAIFFHLNNSLCCGGKKKFND